MSDRDQLTRLLELYVERHLAGGTPPELSILCAEHPHLLDDLRARVADYHQLHETLGVTPEEQADPGDGPLPQVEGFRTIERLGGGGGGEVYKLEDLELKRVVAAKVLRPDRALGSTVSDFLREARSLALFEDPRIVRIHEYRSQSNPPVLLMEYVEGFELHRIAPSLEYRQRARLMIEIAEAIHHAHELGLQHRDLKPANVMVTARLEPKILDFGLSRGDSAGGHGLGTPAYMAPEQLDPGRPIDRRTDVYALGVMLYEMLCGTLPGDPVRLPIEIEPEVPEPLQAIALKAMEPAPADRYPSARELVLELRRYLEGKPVLARPGLYQSTLARRVRPHLEQIHEWVRIRLVYPHEARRLQSAYAALEADEEDWIVGSRRLSFSQITLYLGAALVVCGALLFLVAHALGSVRGVLAPLLALGLPFVGLNAVGRGLYRRRRPAVGLAFHLAAVVLLPALLLIVLQEAGVWPAGVGDGLELLEDHASNRQLQVATLFAAGWAGLLALRTRTVGLSTSCTVLTVVFYLALLGSLGLRPWLEQGRFDRLALHLGPLVVALGGAGWLLEGAGRPWFARPLHVAAAGLFVVALELLALDGRALAYLGLSTAPLQQGGAISDPLLLDTVVALTFNGLLFYVAGQLLERRGTPVMGEVSWLLYSIAPFATLEPVAYLNRVGEYSYRFLWLYLILSLTIALLSHYRQRKSFYFAGLINTAVATWFITDRYDWIDRPLWAATVLAVGMLLLGCGLALAIRERPQPEGSRS